MKRKTEQKIPIEEAPFLAALLSILGSDVREEHRKLSAAHHLENLKDLAERELAVRGYPEDIANIFFVKEIGFRLVLDDPAYSQYEVEMFINDSAVRCIKDPDRDELLSVRNHPNAPTLRVPVDVANLNPLHMLPLRPAAHLKEHTQRFSSTDLALVKVVSILRFSGAINHLLLVAKLWTQAVVLTEVKSLGIRLQAIKGADAKKKKDPKQIAKAKIKAMWVDWQAGRSIHRTGAAFARAAVNAHPAIEDPNSVTTWITEWRKSKNTS